MDNKVENRTAEAQPTLTMTAAAAARIKSQLAKRGHGLGLRVGVRKSGCSGYMYTMDYADEVAETDHVFRDHGAQLVIDRKHLQVLEGTIIDFRREGLNEMFRFDNPHAEHACGCGESFTV